MADRCEALVRLGVNGPWSRALPPWP